MALKKTIGNLKPKISVENPPFWGWCISRASDTLLTVEAIHLALISTPSYNQNQKRNTPELR